MTSQSAKTYQGAGALSKQWQTQSGGPSAPLTRRWCRRASVGVATLLLVVAAAGATCAQAQTATVTAQKDLGDPGQLIIPSLNINEAELDDVLVALAQFSGLNIISGAQTSNKRVSVYWQNVTVQEAMEALLETNELGYLYKNGIVRILPASKLGEDQVITVTRVFKIDYLSAGELAGSLQEAASENGEVEVNQESNSILVTDRPEVVERVADLITQLDTRFLQVVIEAMLWEVSFSDDQSVGIDWNVFGDDPTDRFDVNLGKAGSAALNQVLPGGSLQLGFIEDDLTFSGFLNMLHENSDVNILAHPYILARNNKGADIQLQDQLPFVETSVSNGVVTESVNYQEVGIQLQVTPHITTDDHIIMDLLLSQRIPGPTVQLGNSTAFSVDERIESTTLIIPDHKTVIIGGLFDTDSSYSITKVPMLGDLPLFGHFFRKKTITENRTDLMLSITPHIVKDEPEELTKEQQFRLDQFDVQRKRLSMQLDELLERQEAKHGGLKDKVFDETANNMDRILYGEKGNPRKGSPFVQEYIPADPYTDRHATPAEAAPPAEGSAPAGDAAPAAADEAAAGDDTTAMADDRPQAETEPGGAK